jgi:hypothetical protein
MLYCSYSLLKPIYSALRNWELRTASSPLEYFVIACFTGSPASWQDARHEADVETVLQTP